MKPFRHIGVPWLLVAGAVGVAAAAAAAGAGSVAGVAASQEAQLRAALADTAVAITRNDTELQLKIPASSTFVADASALLPASKAWLDAVVRSLRKHKRTQMVVAVFTDAIGSAAFNQAQAQTRASAVTAYLESHGVAAHRLIARGVGEAQPINSDNTPEGRSLNRRIELTISDSQAKS